MQTKNGKLKIEVDTLEIERLGYQVQRREPGKQNVAIVFSVTGETVLKVIDATEIAVVVNCNEEGTTAKHVHVTTKNGKVVAICDGSSEIYADEDEK